MKKWKEEEMKKIYTKIKEKKRKNKRKVERVWVWVLFNGISTPVGHLMPKRLFLISVIKIAVL